MNIPRSVLESVGVELIREQQERFRKAADFLECIETLLDLAEFAEMQRHNPVLLESYFAPESCHRSKSKIKPCRDSGCWNA